jgi:hypothetical protein
MAPGAYTTHPHFTLDNKDDGGAVASMLAGLLALTLLPSLSMADASWGMVGVEGGRQTPAASRRASCLRGGMSVLLALTDVPFLALFSLFAGGFGGGGLAW